VTCERARADCIKLFSQDPALLKTWAPQVGEAFKKIQAVRTCSTESRTPSAVRRPCSGWTS